MPRSTSSSTQYASSRRAKLEQKQLTRQLVIFIGLTVGVIVVFIFVVIPTLIRILASLSGNLPTAADDVPVQIPFVSAPVPATSSASIKLSGFSQKGYTVAIVDNGQPPVKQLASDDGSFQVDVNLEKGDNKIIVFAIDQNNKESAPTSEMSIIFDDEKPLLEVTKPTENQSMQGKQNQALTVEGKSDPNTKVYINGRLVFVKEDGAFSSIVQLQEGDNTLDIKAVDQAGNTTEKQIKVTFRN